MFPAGTGAAFATVVSVEVGAAQVQGMHRIGGDDPEACPRHAGQAVPVPSGDCRDHHSEVQWYKKEQINGDID